MKYSVEQIKRGTKAFIEGKETDVPKTLMTALASIRVDEYNIIVTQLSKALGKDHRKDKTSLEWILKEIPAQQMQFAEWIDLHGTRHNLNKWKYKGDNYSNVYTTQEMLEIFKKQLWK